MQSRGARAALAALAIGVVVVLFIVLRDGDGDDGESTTAQTTTTTTTEPAGSGGAEKPEKPEKPDKPEVATIVVKGGKPAGGVQELEFTKGDAIRFVVESDVDEEVHLHGYDVSEDVTAGGKVAFDVPATLEGVFEVELEHSVVPIAEITVNPA